MTFTLEQLKAAAASGELDGPDSAHLRALLARLEEEALAEKEWTALGERKVKPATALGEQQAKPATAPVVHQLSHDPKPGDVLVYVAPYAEAGFQLNVTEGWRNVLYCTPGRSHVGFLNAELAAAIHTGLRPEDRGVIVRVSKAGIDPYDLAALLGSMGLYEIDHFAKAVEHLESVRTACRWHAFVCTSDIPERAEKAWAVRKALIDSDVCDPEEYKRMTAERDDGFAEPEDRARARMLHRALEAWRGPPGSLNGGGTSAA